MLNNTDEKHSLNQRQMWKTLWNQKVSLNILTFIWRLMIKSLPIKTGLNKTM